ncbi:MAG TPA: DNA ligase D [Cyclobacteriaceae bacterium]|nr:DNA ligase D [Cyclobacteriaceae bacterium]
MGLQEYSKKRDFAKTPEPKAIVKNSQGPLKFVVQRHEARRLHYDLRLEMDGVLKSWAVPKGPSMNPKDKRLAIHTEDHPMDYLTFQGVIPKGNYGAGKMAIWDQGTYQGAAGYEGGLVEQLKKGDLKLEFFGKKLKGTFALVQTKRGDADNQWLLIKKEDGFATTLVYDSEEFVPREENLPQSSSIDINQMVKPMLATKSNAIFSKPGWIYELKWDGYRLLTNIQAGKVNLYSRNGISYNQKFFALHQALRAVPYDTILDGEVVVLNEDGISEFQKLQNYGEETKGELRYYVFDLLYLNGHDISHLPLVERKSLIKDVIEGVPLVFYCDHIDSMGNTFYDQAIAAGMEGVIAKKADSSYDAGVRTENWLKIKSIESQETLICGYTQSDGHMFGSLILGIYKDGQLTYAGNCGSGFNDALQKELLELFQPYIQKESPFNKRINLKGRKPTWLTPELVCEVKFSEWTTSGSMRHPVFKGMRSDKVPVDIQQEEVSAAPVKEKKPSNSADTLEVNGYAVPISNLDKIYWPESSITKFHLIDYYLAIADFILPYLKDRPQNLHRYPEGIHKESFYQKDTAGIFPHWIDTVDVYSKSNGKEIKYMLCQHEATLLYMANLGCIEINPWNSRQDALEFPDYAVIDIDPSDKNTFEEVIEVAQVAKEVIDRIQIEAFCKTSGSSGMHIYIPLGAQYTHDESRDFTKLLCYLVHEELPELTSMERQVDKRKGKIYLDFLQNRKGQTLAAPYCVRPKPGATVSTPLEWEEVKPGLDMHAFNIFTMMGRLKEKPDLFKGVLQEGINIEKALERLEG